ncbi:hypothetical protein TBLA_0F01630 [Henningerozyma blattae CBS 6284]|uniref:Cyclin-like domain-containing protein n=1 Tax=Henningerozyma blattae (strain ATCC 34711 / CBS 6284 / DSM 70876 / NBRC 10599 / NRRL Y-10934 / UCD 77-7) TaxID=1071380 RepID=I2H5Q3_HENB6|nr:hypothetical protein TBLA_0F01630 [Tetrapisispora blattae CBS 6284]CCH61705.1 hypothetical protein TBLA_0F01630 [Tetrapisispora blattae CBS 6284]
MPNCNFDINSDEYKAFHIKLSRTRRHISCVKAKNKSLVRNENLAHCTTFLNVYSVDILKYHLSLDTLPTDRNSTMVEFTIEPSILNIRSLILDFIYSSHTRLSLSSITLFQTFNLIDKFIKNFKISTNNFQLMALTCLWLSIKLHEPKAKIISINTLVSLCNNFFNRDQFINMEFTILKSFEWSIGCLNFTNLLDLFLLNNGHRNNTSIPINHLIRYGSIMLLELFYFHPKCYEIFQTYSQSEIVMASVLSVSLSLSLILKNSFNSQNNLKINSLVEDSRLIDLINIFIKFSQDKRSHPTTFNIKYSSQNRNSSIILSALKNYNETNLVPPPNFTSTLNTNLKFDFVPSDSPKIIGSSSYQAIQNQTPNSKHPSSANSTSYFQMVSSHDLLATPKTPSNNSNGTSSTPSLLTSASHTLDRSVIRNISVKHNNALMTPSTPVSSPPPSNRSNANIFNSMTSPGSTYNPMYLFPNFQKLSLQISINTPAQMSTILNILFNQNLLSKKRSANISNLDNDSNDYNAKRSKRSFP